MAFLNVINEITTLVFKLQDILRGKIDRAGWVGKFISNECLQKLQKDYLFDVSMGLYF